MSTITEALRKAQEERHSKPETIGSIPGPLEKELFAMTPGAAAKGPRPSKTAFTAIAVIIVVFPLCAVLSFLFLARPSSSPRPEAHDSLALNIQNLRAIAHPDKLAPAAAERHMSLNGAGHLPVLNGIMYSAILPQAVINGNLVGEGEMVDGFSVIRIFSDRVTLLSAGNEYELRMR